MLSFKKELDVWCELDEYFSRCFVFSESLWDRVVFWIGLLVWCGCVSTLIRLEMDIYLSWIFKRFWSYFLCMFLLLSDHMEDTWTEIMNTFTYFYKHSNIYTLQDIQIQYKQTLRHYLQKKSLELYNTFMNWTSNNPPIKWIINTIQ